MYKLIFYTTPDKNSPITEALLSLNIRQESKVTKAFNYLREFGLDKAVPNLRKISGTPLWELRILGKDNIRIIFSQESIKKLWFCMYLLKRKKKHRFGN